jgi:DNA-binding transcriptional MerR regulator
MTKPTGSKALRESPHSNRRPDAGGQIRAQVHGNVNPHLNSKTGDTEGEPLYSIGPLSEELGLSTRAIRFYEAKGLISPQRAGPNRIYTKRDRVRLLLILRGKRLGFSLDEIAEYLDLYDAGPSKEPQIRHLLGKVAEAMAELETKRADIDGAIAELNAIREQCLAAISEGQ